MTKIQRSDCGCPDPRNLQGNPYTCHSGKVKEEGEDELKELENQDSCCKIVVSSIHDGELGYLNETCMVTMPVDVRMWLRKFHNATSLDEE